MDPYVGHNKICFFDPDSDLAEERELEAEFECNAEPGPGGQEIQISVKIVEIIDGNTGERVECTEKIRSRLAELFQEHVELGHSDCLR